MPPRPAPPAAESGQAIVLVSVVLLGVLMFSGLAVDAGQLYSARRTMQEAADAAAYAGAVVIYQGGTKTSWNGCGATTNAATDAYSAALSDARKNGFDINTVTINNPPRSGAYCGDNRYVEVIIQANVPTSLVPAESGLTAARVRAVAGAEPLNNGYAIMALDRGSTSGAFSTQPNADIHLLGGGILVNSIDPNAAVNMETDGTRFTIQGRVDIAGVDIAGTTSSLWPVCAGSPCFPVRQTQPQVPDPFAGFPRPSTSGLLVCAALNSPGCQDSSGRQNPGVYLVSISGAGNTTITLNPGVYILEGGINAVSGNADIRTPNDASCQGPPNRCGVFLFNTKTNYPTPGPSDTCGGIRLVGNGTSELYAMAYGPYKNLLVYQDPICTALMTIAGNGTFTGTGSVYLPSASFVFDGNNATLVGSQLVANNVNIQNGNISIDFNSGNTAQPILPRLSE